MLKEASSSQKFIGLRYDHKTVFCSFRRWFHRSIATWGRPLVLLSLVYGVMNWGEGQQFTLYSDHQTASASQSDCILFWWRNCKPGEGPRAQTKKTHVFHFRCLQASELIHVENLSLTTSKNTCSSSCRTVPDKKKMTTFKLTVTKTD